MVTRYALVRDGLVADIVLWDGARPSAENPRAWSPPEDVQAIEIGARWCDVGAQYDGVQFIAVTPQMSREDVLSALAAEWTRRKDAGFTYLGKLIDSDMVSRENIANAAMTAMICKSAGIAFSLAPSAGWKCADNTYLALDADGMIGMQTAMVQAGIVLFARAQALKAQIQAADDPSSIDVTAGWPET